MSDLCLLSLTLNQALDKQPKVEPFQITHSSPKSTPTSPTARNNPGQSSNQSCRQSKIPQNPIQQNAIAPPDRAPLPSTRPPHSPPLPLPSSTSPRRGPTSGIQLYRQRLAALRNGRLYTRLPMDSFQPAWQGATGQPTYPQWRKLLNLESRAVARGQGERRLAVLVGDSLSLWYPAEQLPNQHLWLNQGISGDTTQGILQRLEDFRQTRPEVIYVMAGVNDLKQGKTDRAILKNLQSIVTRLQKQHPRADIVLQSILPTRTAQIPHERIERLNHWIAQLARSRNALYLNLYTDFVDWDGMIRSDLTTDGIHLNAQGYRLWQTGLQQATTFIAQRRPSPAIALNR
ncbi:MAG: GDSL-type esterase/lipase family protein [Synechococcales bacterium]|nr:GDSL-type esterase/lipase family protein [Synechococcales bacterium]